MLMRLLCCTLYFLSVAASAAGAGAPPCAPITVALYDHGALYHRNDDGSWGGVDKDLIEELGKRTGCPFTTINESRVRIWAMLEAGQLDMSVSGIPTPEREKFARFVPYMVTHNYVLLAKSVDPAVRGMADFLADPHYKVGVVKSFKHGPVFDPWLDKLRAQGRVYDSPDFTSLAHLLEIGRVHAVIALPTSWTPALRHAGLADKVKVMDWAPGDHIIGALILSRARVPKASADRIEHAVRAMHADGTLAAIYRRHVSAEMAAELAGF